MSSNRRILSPSAPSFGRRALFVLDEAPAAPIRLSDDARLFALTFAGGFLFMSVYLA